MNICLFKTLKYLVLLQLFFLFSNNSFSDSTFVVDSINGEEIMKIAEKTSNADSSIYLYQEASELFKNAMEPMRWVKAQIKIGDIYAYKLSDFSRAIAHLDSAISKAKWIDYEPYQAGLYINLGYMQIVNGEVIKAKYAYEKAREFYEIEKDSVYLPYVYNPLATIYLNLGEYEKSQTLLNMALNINIAHQNYDRVIDNILNLVVTYDFLGKTQKKLDIYQRGIQIQDLSGPMKGALMVSLADELTSEKKFNQAEKYALEAIKLLKNVQSSPTFNYLTPSLIEVYKGISGIYLNKGDVIKASYYLRQSFTTAKEYYKADFHREIAKIYIAFGNLYTQNCDYEVAKIYFQKSLRCVIPGYSPQNLNVYPADKEYYPETFIMYGLEGLGNTHLKKYQSEQNIEYLHLALQGYLGSMTIADTLRSLYRYESSSLQLLKENTLLIEKALQVLYKLYEQTKDEKYAEQAFQISEKNKAILMQESAQKAEAEQGANVPIYYLKWLKELQGEIDELNWDRFREEEKGVEANDSTIHELKMEAFDLKEIYDSISLVIEETYPDYQRLKSALPEVTIAKVQKKLKGSETSLIEYFVGIEDIYILAISVNEIQFRQIHIADTAFETELYSFLKILPYGSKFKDESVAEQTRQAYINHASTLYKLLLAPVLDGKKLRKKLIIIPDGMMSYLPFDILLKSKPGPISSYRSFDYVLKDHIIRYENSAAFFLNNSTRKRKTVTQFGGYAPSYKDNWVAMAKDSVRGFEKFRKGFGALNNTQKEVENIQAIFGGDTYTSYKATEQSFRKTASQYQILHLAMHAFTNDADPLYSGLIFTQTQDGNREEMIPTTGEPSSDNFLLAYEIYNLGLQADLAVLSACRTGLGKLEKGEGVMNLARAFRYAGCPNVLMSLWDADDYATRIIMESFYANLKSGLGKDEALHKAKVDFVMNANPDKLPPSYWATFILIGDDEPISSADLIWEKGMYTFLILLLIFLGISWYRRRKLS